MSIISISTILVASALPCLILLKSRSRSVFVASLFLVAMNFFFFGFHVHEKTILLPLLPLALIMTKFGEIAFDFVIAANLTMFHLMKEDGLGLQYIVFQAICFFVLKPCFLAISRIQQEKEENHELDGFGIAIAKLRKFFRIFYIQYGQSAFYSAMTVLHILDQFINMNSDAVENNLFAREKTFEFVTHDFTFLLMNIHPLLTGIFRNRRTRCRDSCVIFH